MPVLASIITELSLYGFCAMFINAPLFSHTTTDFYSTSTVVESSQVVVTITVTSTVSGGTLYVTQLATETLSVTFTAATQTS